MKTSPGFTKRAVLTFWILLSIWLVGTAGWKIALNAMDTQVYLDQYTSQDYITETILSFGATMIIIVLSLISMINFNIPILVLFVKGKLRPIQYLVLSCEMEFFALIMLFIQVGLDLVNVFDFIFTGGIFVITTAQLIYASVVMHRARKGLTPTGAAGFESPKSDQLNVELGAVNPTRGNGEVRGISPASATTTGTRGETMNPKAAQNSWEAQGVGERS